MWRWHFLSCTSGSRPFLVRRGARVDGSCRSPPRFASNAEKCTFRSLATASTYPLPLTLLLHVTPLSTLTCVTSGVTPLLSLSLSFQRGDVCLACRSRPPGSPTHRSPFLCVLLRVFRSPPAGGQVHAKNARAGLVVRHPGRPDRDGEPVHDVQGAGGGSVLSNVKATVVYSPMPSVGGQTPPQRAVDLEPVRGSSRAVSRSRRNTRTWKFVCVE